MRLEKLEPNLLLYLANSQAQPGDILPTLNQLSAELGVSLGKLREQLAIARQMGLVSVKPKVGIRRERFDFSSTVLPAALFSIAAHEATFSHFSHLRQSLETAMWSEAVQALTPQDKTNLKQILHQAKTKLHGEPAHIPNDEHRAFHLTIFRRLQNPYIQGIFAAYWDVYEASELTRLADYQYWLDVWRCHEQIAQAIFDQKFDQGLTTLIDHFKLLPTVSPPSGSQIR